MSQTLHCLQCDKHYSWLDIRYRCQCGGLLEFRQASPSLSLDTIEKRRGSRDPLDSSGVWRFREAIAPLPAASIVTRREGQTPLYRDRGLAQWAGMDQASFKHEGHNPTGSFKDRGMTVAVSMAKHLGKKVVACASTGNTSSSLASYAAQAGMKAYVFLPAGKVSQGKMAQTLGFGARGIALRGDFDLAMQEVERCANQGLVYLVNSLNPYRIEGQKSIIWEALSDRNWQVPDGFLVPGGNLGNTSAFGKALVEAKRLGWIKKLPRLVTVQAEGANPFAQSYRNGFRTLAKMQAETVATAIRIGNPVNFPRAVQAINVCQGMVIDVSDREIMAAKAAIDRAGIGAEPASAASLAGLRKLREGGSIRQDEDWVLVLTGNILKDTDAILASKDLICDEIEADAKAIEALFQ